MASCKQIKYYTTKTAEYILVCSNYKFAQLTQPLNPFQTEFFSEKEMMQLAIYNWPLFKSNGGMLYMVGKL